MSEHPRPFPMPAEDRVLSPVTGWTRAHWEAAADGLLAAVRPHAGPEHALINLPGTRPSWSGPRSDQDFAALVGLLLRGLTAPR